jgi:DNA-binding NarL/FixJ family response regulator
MGEPNQPTRLRVIIADDSGPIRKCLTNLLADIERVEVVAEAGTGMEAIRLVEKHRPDVLILDLVMPQGSGLGVLRTLQEARAPTEDHRLYAYTYYQRACLELGAAFFLHKAAELLCVPQILREMSRTDT